IGLPPERISVNNLFRRYCDRRLNFSFFRNPFCEQYLTRAIQATYHHPAIHKPLDCKNNGSCMAVIKLLAKDFCKRRKPA
ncbi:hypothetical protein, partial [Phocaeicola sp.]|uniref:hypothetical protein n=1 Tax=Phocaeicola sp. TaxID=2773926 RepID=UPI002A820F57